MKVLLDITCERCGGTASLAAISWEEARRISKTHVCPDGVSFKVHKFKERTVSGPGERLSEDTPIN